MNFIEGVVVMMNRTESSLVSEVKTKQDQDPILKTNVHKNSLHLLLGCICPKFLP